MYAMIAFDTEDVYIPEEHRIDDMPGWLAQIMTETGVTGTFFVMEQKTRSLLARGRTDVLEKMAKHDIASHQKGNVQPLIPQLMEGKDWASGLAIMRAYEDEVSAVLQEGFGKEPVGFSRHNSYFAPQHVAVAGERGLPYMYFTQQIPGSRQPVWYAGAVTFPHTAEFCYGCFDMIYSRDEVFERALGGLEAFLARALEADQECVTVFACHPVRVMSRGWQEYYLMASGNTRTPQELGWHYGVKSPVEEARAKANFRRLCERLRDHPDIDVVGMSEAGRLFATQPETISRDALIAYAKALEAKAEIVFHETFSPAELVCGFADAILADGERGGVPETVARRDVTGPVDRPIVGPESDSVAATEVVSLCRLVAQQAAANGWLPANVEAGALRVGISQFAMLAARYFLAVAAYESYATMRVRPLPRYPLIAYELSDWILKAIGDHYCMPLDFSCERMAELARLQTWSMKPAWLRPPQGHPVSDGGIWGTRAATA